MPIFQFKARNQKGRPVEGEMKAADMQDLRDQLSRVGLSLRSAKETDGYSSTSLGEYLFMPYEWLEIVVERIFSIFIRPAKHNYDPKHFERTRKERALIRQRLAKGDTSRMPTFFYHAQTAQGRRIEGEMEAKDEADLANRLQLLELKLIEGQKVGLDDADNDTMESRAKPVSPEDELIFAEQLQIYFKIEMLPPDIFSAISIGCDSENLRNVVLKIRNHLTQGQSLSYALKFFPRGTFSQFFISVLEVGETTGRLSAVLMYASRHLRWLRDFRRDAINRLRDQFVSLWCIVALVLLMIAVKIGWKISFACLFAIVLLCTLCRHSYFAEVRKVIYYHLPMISKIMRLMDVLNFSYLFSISWSAGIVVEQAIVLASNVVGSKQLRRELLIAGEKIKMGAKPSEALGDTELFEPMVIIAFSKAETTGDFESALDGVYYFYKQQLEDSLEDLTSTISAILYGLCIVLIIFLVGLSGRHL